jgi:hypothetical protein
LKNAALCICLPLHLCFLFRSDAFINRTFHFQKACRHLLFSGHNAICEIISNFFFSKVPQSKIPKSCSGIGAAQRPQHFCVQRIASSLFRQQRWPRCKQGSANDTRTCFFSKKISLVCISFKNGSQHMQHIEHSSRKSPKSDAGWAHRSSQHVRILAQSRSSASSMSKISDSKMTSRERNPSNSSTQSASMNLQFNLKLKKKSENEWINSIKLFPLK